MGVICKYFQQGRCRFGNECKFQHSDVYDDGGGSNRGGRLADQYHYFKPEKPDVTAVLQAVQQEIVATEKGKQWPLSCFAPLKEYGNIAGWEDISPEELRWQTYLSRQSGNLDECIRLVQEVHNKAKMKKNIMLNPTSETYSTLETIFTKDASSFSFAQKEGQTASAFTPGGSGVFGGQTSFGSTLAAGHSSSIFGGSSSATPAFAGPTAFGNVASANVFGNVAATPANVFGNVAATPANVFGNVATTPANVFGNVAATPANVFGNVAATPANVFGNVATTPANVFGNVAASPGNVFGNVAASPGNVFGNVAASPGNVFGNVAASPANMFGNAATFGGAQAHSSSIFGGHQTQAVGNTAQHFQTSTAAGFGSDRNASAAGDDAYTPLAQLSEDVLALFRADKFVMGKIPTVPPPRELCH